MHTYIHVATCAVLIEIYQKLLALQQVHIHPHTCFIATISPKSHSHSCSISLSAWFRIVRTPWYTVNTYHAYNPNLHSSATTTMITNKKGYSMTGPFIIDHNDLVEAEGDLITAWTRLILELTIVSRHCIYTQCIVVCSMGLVWRESWADIAFIYTYIPL